MERVEEESREVRGNVLPPPNAAQHSLTFTAQAPPVKPRITQSNARTSMHAGTLAAMSISLKKRCDADQ